MLFGNWKNTYIQVYNHKYNKLFRGNLKIKINYI